MSGHSKWSKIKHKKSLTDAKKGKVFSKLSQLIIVASRDGGPDPDANISLRLLLEKAKQASMPAENVKRAIERGSGTGKDAVILEKALYEGYGPHQVSMIIDVLTDNKNRVVADIRNIFNENGGHFADSGAVSWNFDQKASIILKSARMEKAEKFGAEDKEVEVPMEDAMMELMEVDGAQDIHDFTEVDEDGKSHQKFEIYADPKSLSHVRDQVIALGYILESAELIWVPKTHKDITDVEKERIDRFVEVLEELDDVQGIYMDI